MKIYYNLFVLFKRIVIILKRIEYLYLSNTFYIGKLYNLEIEIYSHTKV